MDLAHTLPTLLTIAWLLPLASFTLIVFGGPRMGKGGGKAAYVATGAIVLSCVLSTSGLIGWISHYGFKGATEEAAAGEAAGHAEGGHVEGTEPAGEGHAIHPPVAYSGDWYTLGQFGSLRLSMGYYIDALTIVMFTMVTLIASCIHFYAAGYMHDELHAIDDHEVTLSDGHHLHRKGRFHRFFQYLSLFCFAMLGLVIAGNILMVFVFWELVGICSYFLIGFYIERRSASTAANKAFIVNRVGDFGMIIGLMALWGSLGTFSFADRPETVDAAGATQPAEAGLFSLVRPAANHYLLTVPDGMVVQTERGQVAQIVRESPDAKTAAAKIAASIPGWRTASKCNCAYWLLIIAGLGIFCGCVGKSAQFPLQVWLPDAMEGPTPVSALVHSATMVAAGVYLVGRFFPVFTPEVLLVIAYCGGITLFLAATIAIVATDIKRVLAYSTISQLGYMMLALGVGGWLAGLFHLITHAFFKSLLFMCSGSVIHACHTNEMTRMGGLRHKMPWTAYTMLVGCLAIMGAGIPFLFGFSGFHSKDSIIEQALLFKQNNPSHAILFYVAAGGAAITAFYMFRLWFMTFAGPPRDHHVYDHAHESPRIMYVPLVILAVFATVIGWPILHLTDLLEQARPAGASGLIEYGVLNTTLKYDLEHARHGFATGATLWASGTALAGFLLALFIYGLRRVDPNAIRRPLEPVYQFLRHKWYFDELYNALFVQPTLFISRRISDFDRLVIDRFINFCALLVRSIARIDDLIDRLFVDGLVNLMARWTYAGGLKLRDAQTGKLRQYVMFIVVGTVALFVVVSLLRQLAFATP